MRDEVTVLVNEKYNLMLREFYSFLGSHELHEWARMIFATPKAIGTQIG